MSRGKTYGASDLHAVFDYFSLAELALGYLFIAVLALP